MTNPLGERIYREYRWFALILLALLIGFANRIVSTQLSTPQLSHLKSEIPAQLNTPRERHERHRPRLGA
jgi:hypothetical protein